MYVQMAIRADGRAYSVDTDGVGEVGEKARKRAWRTREIGLRLMGKVRG